MKKFIPVMLTFIMIISMAVSCKPVENYANGDTAFDIPEIQQPTCTEETTNEIGADDIVVKSIPNYKILGYGIKNERGEVQAQNVIFDGFDTTFDDPQTSRMTVERLGFEDADEYDEAFFENRAVFKIFFSSSYADYSYYVSHINIGEDAITFGISRTVQEPNALMSDIGGGKVFLVDAERSKIEGISKISAVDTTDHKTFFAAVSKGPQSGFSMDMNSKEFAMTCYTPTTGGDYDELYLKGSYRLDGDALTLLAEKSKFVFKIVSDGFAYDAEKSVVEENTTLIDGMLFYENGSN